MFSPTGIVLPEETYKDLFRDFAIKKKKKLTMNTIVEAKYAGDGGVAQRNFIKDAQVGWKVWSILQHICIYVKTLISWPKLPSDNWASDGIFVWRDFCFVFRAHTT